MPSKELKNVKLNVVELFAGVGGFRLGLEAVHGSPFSVTLSNQYEPARKVQHASTVYKSHWRDGVHLNEDIAIVLKSGDFQRAIRVAAPDVVVGGFPCQDYSVAKPLSHSKGIEGKKGVLWWSISGLLKQRIDDGEPVKYLVLENVDRLLSSPASCRGRDFSVVLATLYGLGYAVEWRIVNAAEYGFPQNRRRIFIVAYHKSTGAYRRMKEELTTDAGWHTQAVLTKAFPSTLVAPLDAVNPSLTIRNEPLLQQFVYTPLSNGKSRFANAGFMVEGRVWSCRVTTDLPAGYAEFTGSSTARTLGDVISKTSLVPSSFYVQEEAEERWRLAKAAKSIPREKNGFSYTYSEGTMPYPDRLDRPARTIITSEGGPTATRSKHLVREASGLLRRLLPEELEELNGFPRGFTDHAEISDITRAMLMGNALVVGLVTRIGSALMQTIAPDYHPLE